MIHIGGVDAETMEATADAVIRVATCSPVPEVALAALDALTRSVQPNNHLAIHGSSFVNEAPAAGGVRVLGSEEQERLGSLSDAAYGSGPAGV